MNKLLATWVLDDGTDVVKLAESILSGLPPLLIWGILRESEVNAGAYTANAVDIKSGDKLFFEFHPDLICLYGQEDNPAITNKIDDFLEND
jgi:hypothetical protein